MTDEKTLIVTMTLDEAVLVRRALLMLADRDQRAAGGQDGPEPPGWAVFDRVSTALLRARQDERAREDA